MAKRSIPTTAANQPQQKSILKSSSILAGNKRARFDTTNATTAGKKARPTPAKKVKRSSVLLPVNHSNSNSTKSVKSISIKTTPPPAAPTTFIVSVGSYERLLYGLSCTFSIDANSTTGFTLSLNPIFSFPAHLSSIKSVATSLLASPQTGSERKVGGKYLVSGGTDEVIKVWDLKRKKEVGSLEGEAAGTITCLRFVPQRNMLLAASTESTISMYRVRDWVLLRSLKAHKGRVNAVDAHPDGRVALSVGQDKMLRMWDLVAGKAVATMKLGQEGDLVRWNSNGTKFAVIGGSTLTVYGVDMAVHHTLTAPSRFHDLRFCFFPIDASDPTQCEYLFVACEDGKTRVFDITTSAETAKTMSEEIGEDETPAIEQVAILIGHTNRVKMMDLLEVALPSPTPTPTSTSEESAEPTTTIVLTTVSSDGQVHLYDLASLKLARTSSTIDPLTAQQVMGEVAPTASYDTDKSRLTCVCVVGVVEKTEKVPALGEEDQEGNDSAEEDDEDSEDEDEDVEGEEFQGIGSDSGEEEEEEEEEGEGELEFEDEE